MRTACATHSSLITGSMPGMAASTSETWLLGAPPNAVDAPENSLACESTWAWTSMPMTTSQSPVAPLRRLADFRRGAADAVEMAVIVKAPNAAARGRQRAPAPRAGGS